MIERLLAKIRALHERIRDRVVAACESTATAELAAVARDDEGDTIYAIDETSEEELLDFCESELASVAPIAVVAEGLGSRPVVLPAGADPRWRVIIDPIDGTRGLMYQKRSAWILTGVAPERGAATTLAGIELAVQTEIPTVKQHLSDCLWAVRGRGASAERFDRLRGTRAAFRPEPSRAVTIEHGFAQISRFFPGAREELAAIDEEIARELIGPPQHGKAAYFEDQYVSSGGQLYELMVGHDRFCADLRPLMEGRLAARGEALGICAHPYDLCTELIARELGVAVVEPGGAPLAAPLDLETDVAWAGYANAAIRRQVEPALQAALARRGL